ncbi:MAG: hypothetical protein M3362_02335 [Acidobacteriota bacterium]|nr:hypothetical protein [Acidobacteriota bacterium]
MEEKQVEIWRDARSGSKEKIGSIFFYENVTSLEVQRTATNLHLRIPSEIKLDWPKEDALRPMLTNLRVVISLMDSSLGKIEVGIARDEEYRIATTMPESILQPEFIWRDALAGLIFIEKTCAGDSPTLELELHGELCYIARCKGWDRKEVIRMHDLAIDTRTPPYQRLHGRVEVSYRSDVWTKMIQTVFEAAKDNPLLMLQPLLPFLMGNK